MPLFARDESRPGRPLLMFGLAAFILAVLGGLALLWGQPSLASKLIAELMLALFQAVIVIVSIVLGMLILAVLSGVPTLSVDHGWVGRFWRTIFGAVLLLSAIKAILDIARVADL
jgi:hypothetical protein